MAFPVMMLCPHERGYCVASVREAGSRLFALAAHQAPHFAEHRQRLRPQRAILENPDAQRHGHLLDLALLDEIGEFLRLEARRRHRRVLLDVQPVGIEAQRDMAFQPLRSEEHTSELQSLMRNSYTVFCLKKKTKR